MIRCIYNDDEVFISETFPKAVSVMVIEPVWNSGLKEAANIKFQKPLRLSVSVILPPFYPYQPLRVKVHSNNPATQLPDTFYAKIEQYLNEYSHSRLGETHLMDAISQAKEYLLEDEDLMDLAIKETTDELEGKQNRVNSHFAHLLAEDYKVVTKNVLVQLYERTHLVEKVDLRVSSGDRLRNLANQFDHTAEVECPSR